MADLTEPQQKYILKFFETKSARRIARDMRVSRAAVVSFLEKNTRGSAEKKQTPSARSRVYYTLLSIAVLFLTTLICYFRLIARNDIGELTHIIRWDVADFTYPLLIFISDSIRNFIFPLWNPYQYCGTPCALNPGTVAYNPICLLVILFKGYSLELLQLQTFSIFFIAGVSTYFCLRSFSLSKTASLIGAISYMSCGFFVAGAEYFTLITMMAVLPICLMLLNRLLDRLDLRSLCLGALAVAALAFCGHPTMLVTFIYFLFLFGLLKIFFVDGNLQRAIVFRKVSYFFGFFALGLLSAAILLIPGAELAGLSTRSGGVSLETVKIDALPFCHLGSMWYPFLALKDFPSAPLDIALRNCSIGIFGLFFAIYYLLFNGKRLKWSLLMLFLGSLIMAFGDNIAAYKLIIKFVPLIKHFRHPAVDYRAIFLFLLCLCAGFGVEEMRRRANNWLKKSLIAYSIFISTAILTYLYIKSVYKIDIAAMALKDYPFILVSFLLLSIVTALSSNISKRWFSAMIILFCIIDVSHWTKVNFFTVAIPAETGVWASFKASESGRNFKVDKNESFARQLGTYPVSVEHNFGMAAKRFSATGYEPLILRHYDEFIKSKAGVLVTEDFRVLPLYEVRLLPDDKSVLSEINNGADLHKIALINKRDIKDPLLLDRLGRLSSVGNNGFSARIIHYDPNSIDYEINTTSPAVIFFNEIYYPGWRLFSSTKELPLFKVNHAFRGTYLEAGFYRLKMPFSPFSFNIGLIISLCSFGFIFYNIFVRRKTRP